MRFTPDMKRLHWLVARPVAHRGLHDKSAGVLENTRSAFAAAVNLGYAIECDLQITRDGEAVVFHDKTVNRVMQGEGRVDSFSVEQLKAIPYKVSGDRIQTLGEMLAQVSGKVPLVIEIKSQWDGDERLTLRALKILESYTGPYCLMSFDADVVAAIARYSPHTVRGIVGDRANDAEYLELPFARRLEMRRLTHLARTKPDFISFYWRELPWAPVTAFRSAGLPLLSWTIRSPEAMSQALRYSDQVTFERFLA